MMRRRGEGGGGVFYTDDDDDDDDEEEEEEEEDDEDEDDNNPTNHLVRTLYPQTCETTLKNHVFLPIQGSGTILRTRFRASGATD